jgi:hypothetical protein
VVDQRHDVAGARTHSRAAHPDLHALPELASDHVPVVLTAARRAGWVDDLMVLLRNEIQNAADRGVINVGESEQLLSRLAVLIDQALARP